MKHLIFAAFGTTTAARKTYERLGALLEPHFASCTIHWTYTSPVVRNNLQREAKEEVLSLEVLIKELSLDPHNQLVIQSLHVLPGHEFHRIVRHSSAATVPVSIGMPLLTTPSDYIRIAHCLTPLLLETEGRAVLLLGHGTDHPCWTGYPALQEVFKRIGSNHVYVGALEKYPDSSSLIDEIITAGYHHVLIIPFLMVAGMHFKRDIVGDAPGSWESKFKQNNIRVTLHDQGLGMLAGVEDIFHDHIKEAFASLTIP